MVAMAVAWIPESRGLTSVSWVAEMSLYTSHHTWLPDAFNVHWIVLGMQIP